MNIKLIIDAIMTIILILLMRIDFLNLNLHELLGLIIFGLFITHKVLNLKTIIQTIKKWKNLPLKNKVGMGLDFLILIDFILLVISSISISNNIFKFLKINSNIIWSDLHHFFAYLLLILISIHIGFHYNIILKLIEKKLKIKDNKFKKYSYLLISVLLLIFGVKNILNYNFYKYFLKPFGFKEKSQIIETPTEHKISFEEYIKDKHCDGCFRHCPLTNLRCSTGQIYLEKAREEYNHKYSITTKDNLKIDIELNKIDYIIIMSFIVGLTHYVIKIKK